MNTGRRTFMRATVGQNASIEIDTLDLISGRLPPRVRGLVTEWAAMHIVELRENWELARQGTPLKRIEPLG